MPDYGTSGKSKEQLLSSVESLQNQLDQVAKDYIRVTNGVEDFETSVDLLESWIHTKSKSYFDEIKCLITSNYMCEDTFINFKTKIERNADYFTFMIPENKDDPMAYESIYNVMIDLSGNLTNELHNILKNSKMKVDMA